MRQRGNSDRTWTGAATIAAAGVIGLLLASCRAHDDVGATEARRPGWIDRPLEGAGERVLVGVGVGPTRDAAINAALARVAQSIEVRVIAQEDSRTTGQVREQYGERAASATSSIDRSVRLIADQRLAAMRIDRTWQDPVSGEWNARVSVDRAEAAAAFDRRAHDAMRRAEAASSRADRLAGWSSIMSRRDAAVAAGEAIDAAQARDALWGGPWTIAIEQIRKRESDFRTDWEVARADVRIAVQWWTSESRAAGDIVASQIAQYGLLALAGDADLLIECDLELMTGSAFDGRTRATRWTLSLRAVSADDRRLVARLHESGSSVSRGDSERAAREAATSRLRESLPRFLDELFRAGGSL